MTELSDEARREHARHRERIMLIKAIYYGAWNLTMFFGWMGLAAYLVVWKQWNPLWFIPAFGVMCCCFLGDTERVQRHSIPASQKDDLQADL